MNEVVDPYDWLKDEPAEQEVLLAPVVAATAPAPTAKEERIAQIEAAWAKLNINQQMVLSEMPSAGYNMSEVARRMRARRVKLKYTTIQRWVRTDPNFALCLKAGKEIAHTEFTDNTELLGMTRLVIEDSLKPKSLVNRNGEETGVKRRDGKTALKGLELLMKQQKMLGSNQEKEGGAVDNGPTLIIQIMQPSGTVIQATPGHRPPALEVEEAELIEALPAPAPEPTEKNET